MFEFNIPKTEKETCTTFPSFMLNKVELWLKRNHIEYKVYTGEEIPDEMPHSYEFKGHKSRRGVACVVAKLDNKAFHEAVEALLEIDPEDI